MSGTNLVVSETARRLGAKLLPDNAQWELRMEIHSSTSSRVYIVSRNKSNKTWGCSCMGWIRHRTCKHLEVMVPALESALKSMPKKLG